MEISLVDSEQKEPASSRISACGTRQDTGRGARNVEAKFYIGSRKSSQVLTAVLGCHLLVLRGSQEGVNMGTLPDLHMFRYHYLPS